MDTTTTTQRTVAIVGRPNVGKSALFNAIARQRVAIVHDQSGVTRDRLVREVTWPGAAPFSLIDTGGITAYDKAVQEDAIEAGIRDQVDLALSDAAALILVVDAQHGIHPADREVARLAHRTGLPCFLAANKCDLPEHEHNAHEFAPLGFPVIPISAVHRRGVSALMDELLPKLPPPADNDTLDKPLRVAIVGRPNAGKSSFINKLFGSDRVIVSNIAGTTRDSIEVPFSIGEGDQARHYTLIDTAGMRHVHKIDNSVERFSLFRAEESIKACDVAVIVMDAQIGPTTQDKYISSLIAKDYKACILILNKWDLMEAQGIPQDKATQAFRTVIPYLNHCPLLFTSTKTGLNIRQAIDLIDTVAAQTRSQLPTGLLNRTILRAFDTAVLPSRNGKRLKIYYATQAGTAPVRIRLFVNDPKLATPSFTAHLTARLREQFGLQGAPVVLQYRPRPRPDTPGRKTENTPRKTNPSNSVKRPRR